MTSKHKKIEPGCNTMAQVAAAYEVAAGVLDTHGDSAATEALGAHVCCDGHMCGCRGADVGAYLQHLIRALTPADAKAALDRLIAEAVRRYVDALRALIYHTHECERELTEALYHADFCGESRPLTDARAILAASKKGGA